eukprot:Nitzschia sp. Nitz4//scaffold36_size144017//13588//15793//NITZ4_003066-RA/size144017-snap-gene-0.203-mRNA-1//-1//CDS//3329549396//5769//frame0
MDHCENTRPNHHREKLQNRNQFKQQTQRVSKGKSRSQRNRRPLNDNMANQPKDPKQSTVASIASSRPPARAPRPNYNRRRQHDPNETARQSKLLLETLQARGCLVENQPCDGKRRQALHILETVLTQWSNTVQAERVKSNPWQRPRATLITFGSFRLGVHRPESDLDVLALSPPACSRDDFFTTLVAALQEHKEIKDVHAIPTAYTPVVKFKLMDIQIDMLFARVEDASKLLKFQQAPFQIMSQSPTSSTDAFDLSEQRREYEIDDTDLVGTDEPGVRSLNGVRVTQMILEMVEPNMHSFRVTLCAVKEWAIIQGVYSNVLGFLGGVNFAILVAWVCKRHPTLPPSTLLRIFFRTFATWKWPKPVQLCPVQQQAPPGVPSEMPVWDPVTNHHDARHIMPILTPAYPTMNSTYNVGIPQYRRLQEEMIRAARLLEQGDEHWESLFEPSDFFFRHEHYLQVTIRANNVDDFLPWQRFCESRLRILICALETTQVSAWPFSKFFSRKYTKRGMVRSGGQKSSDDCKQECFFYIALRFPPGVKSVSLRHLTSDFLLRMNTWTSRKEGMDLDLCHIEQSSLPEFVYELENIPPEPQEPAEIKKQREVSTSLTPTLRRSTLDDDDLHAAMASPSKKARRDA